MKLQIEQKKTKLLAKLEKIEAEYMERVAPLKNEIEKLDALLTVLSEHEQKSEIPPALRNMVNTSAQQPTNGESNV